MSQILCKIEVLPEFARPIMRTRNLIFGRRRWDVEGTAGTEFVLPMGVGVGVGKGVGVQLIDMSHDPQLSQLPFLAEALCALQSPVSLR